MKSLRAIYLPKEKNGGGEKQSWQTPYKPAFCFFFFTLHNLFFFFCLFGILFPYQLKKNPPIKIDSKLNKIPPFHPST